MRAAANKPDSPRFYTSVGLADHAFDYNIASASVLVFGSIAAMLLVDVMGRRPILLWGAVFQAIFLFIMASIGDIRHPTPAQANTLVASVILFNFWNSR
jgi:SP family sugar:H+ symporter-like MFS transporter